MRSLRRGWITWIRNNMYRISVEHKCPQQTDRWKVTRIAGRKNNGQLRSGAFFIGLLDEIIHPKAVWEKKHVKKLLFILFCRGFTLNTSPLSFFRSVIAPCNFDRRNAASLNDVGDPLCWAKASALHQQRPHRQNAEFSYQFNWKRF